MAHAQINGFSMHYQLHGDAGEPLVLVHGYTGDVGDFADQIPEFAKTHRVLVLDHRGHGASEGPTDRSSYTITTMADDVEAIAAHAGFERYHLVGHSMGGMVAQEIALRSPDRLLSLMLFGTGPDFPMGKIEPVRKYMEARNRLAEEQGMAAVVALPARFPDPPHMPPGRKDYEKARMLKMPVEGMIGGWNAMASWHGVRDRVKDIRTPTLVMAGALEPAVESIKYLHSQIAGSKIVIVPEAAHCPQFERPEIFNAALRELLTANASVRTA